jgi:hypothetical protein
VQAGGPNTWIQAGFDQLPFLGNGIYAKLSARTLTNSPLNKLAVNDGTHEPDGFRMLAQGVAKYLLRALGIASMMQHHRGTVGIGRRQMTTLGLNQCRHEGMTEGVIYLKSF